MIWEVTALVRIVCQLVSEYQHFFYETFYLNFFYFFFC